MREYIDIPRENITAGNIETYDQDKLFYIALFFVVQSLNILVMGICSGMRAGIRARESRESLPEALSEEQELLIQEMERLNTVLETETDTGLKIPLAIIVEEAEKFKNKINATMLYNQYSTQCILAFLQKKYPEFNSFIYGLLHEQIITQSLDTLKSMNPESDKAIFFLAYMIVAWDKKDVVKQIQEFPALLQERLAQKIEEIELISAFLKDLKNEQDLTDFLAQNGLDSSPVASSSSPATSSSSPAVPSSSPAVPSSPTVVNEPGKLYCSRKLHRE